MATPAAPLSEVGDAVPLGDEASARRGVASLANECVLHGGRVLYTA